MKRGVYTLANDRVYDWLVAFLESFRAQDPDLPLRVIPFDERIDRVAGISKRYDFEILRLPEYEELEQIGRAFHPNDRMWAHAYRKLAVFWGPFEKFAFFDSDIVLLEPLSELFDRAEGSAADFICGDIDMDRCFLPGRLRDELVASGHVTGFNTGFFVSRQNALSLEGLRRLAARGLEVRDGFAPAYGEQPFINWCVDAAGMEVLPYHELMPDVCLSTWAQRTPIRRVDGVWRLLDTSAPDAGRRMPWLHWAGSGLDLRMPNVGIFLRHRLAHASPLDAGRVLGHWASNSSRRVRRAAARRVARLLPAPAA